jgi:hypothetical protein
MLSAPMYTQIFESGTTHTQDTQPGHRANKHTLEPKRTKTENTQTEKNQGPTPTDQTVNIPGHKTGSEGSSSPWTDPSTLRIQAPAANRGA